MFKLDLKKVTSRGKRSRPRVRGSLFPHAYRLTSRTLGGSDFLREINQSKNATLGDVFTLVTSIGEIWNTLLEDLQHIGSGIDDSQFEQD